MIHNLIIPAAGSSSRFSGTRPKWMLTAPSGRMMLVEGVSGLDLTLFDAIYIAVLKEHVDLYFKGIQNLENALRTQFGAEVFKNIVVVELESPTKSQPETVSTLLSMKKVEGSILIKDCDDHFKFDLKSVIGTNFVCSYKLSNSEKINAANKSYATTNDNGYISNIVEKQVISNTFCCGGYSFSSAADYIKTFNELGGLDSLYTSHIIYHMIINNAMFKLQDTTDYHDWGTLTDWLSYLKTFKTIFVDLDGVLVENSSEFFPPFWGETPAIKENVDALNELYNKGRTKVIITTSRSKKYELVTISQLKREGVEFHDIIFDLPAGSQRVIVNDFSSTNPHPSCSAINLKRNSTDLKTYLYGN